jgi:hypothetical protein
VRYVEQAEFDEPGFVAAPVVTVGTEAARNIASDEIVVFNPRTMLKHYRLTFVVHEYDFFSPTCGNHVFTFDSYLDTHVIYSLPEACEILRKLDWIVYGVALKVMA